MADPGTLGGNSSSAYGINSSGDIVGDSSLSNGNTDAFLYEQGHMIDLNILLPTNSGWTLTAARGINDSGWITGQGIIGGLFHAYILRPNAVPEPSALVMFGLGMIAIGAGLKGKSVSTRRRLSRAM